MTKSRRGPKLNRSQLERVRSNLEAALLYLERAAARVERWSHDDLGDHERSVQELRSAVVMARNDLRQALQASGTLAAAGYAPAILATTDDD